MLIKEPTTLFQTLDLLEPICQNITGAPCLRIDGKTPTKQRLKLVDRFNEPTCTERTSLLPLPTTTTITAFLLKSVYLCIQFGMGFAGIPYIVNVSVASRFYTEKISLSIISFY